MYADQWKLVNDEAFRGRVAMALLKAAAEVQAEADSVPEHKARARLAFEITANPVYAVSRFIYHIASNPTIAAAGPTASADSDLDFVIGSVFTKVAKW